MEITVNNLRKLEIDPADIVAIGITNQRETVIVWDKYTGQPLYNAIGKFRLKTVTFIYFKSVGKFSGVRGYIPQNGA
jgi:glycerol kinase